MTEQSHSISIGMQTLETMGTGYQHRGYVESLAEWGIPRELARCRGWILKRQIAGCAESDAMGCYPLFSCEDWRLLEEDLEHLREEIVSLGVVVDPFGEHTPELLRRCFPELVVPFKEHFMIDLQRPLSAFVSKHHERNARKALARVQVELCTDPIDHLDEWVELYEELVHRHNIRGIAAFSRQSFLRQLSVPGIVAFRALHQGATVGMVLWYRQGAVGYYHLAAYREIGYDLRASFALFWNAIDHFAGEGLRWLSLGAGAGATSSGTDGLTRFKQGWSTGTRTAYFCGRIFDAEAYTRLLKARGMTADNYFPAYRKGEFA